MTTGQTFAWQLGPSSTVTTPMETPILGGILRGINWRSAIVYGVDSGGSDTTLLTLDAATGFTSMPYTRVGDVIYPSGSATAGSRYIAPNSLAGGIVDLGSTKYRRIESNSGGVWLGTGAQPPWIRLLDCDDSEPSSGTALFWCPDLAFWVYNTTAYVGIKITVSGLSSGAAAAHPDGYFTINSLMLGSWWTCGVPPGFEWSLTQDGGPVVVTMSEDRTTHARLLSAGADQRVLDLQWIDPVDQQQTYRASAPTPDYVVHRTGVAPLAGRYDTLEMLQGLYRRLRGPLTPVGFCLAIDTGGSDTWQSNDRARFLVGRLGEPPSIEHVWGQEFLRPVQRVTGRVSIREDV